MPDAATFLRDTLDPGRAWCQSLPGWTIPFDDRARVLLLAIAGQESGRATREQAGNGPAHGFWQFEKGGAVEGELDHGRYVHGVLTHDLVGSLAAEACRTMYVKPDAQHAWAVLATERGDNLAVAFARLLLWSDPAPLPPLISSSEAWDAYVRNWRPGKPRPETWPAIWAQARDAVLLGTPVVTA